MLLVFIYQPTDGSEGPVSASWHQPFSPCIPQGPVVSSNDPEKDPFLPTPESPRWNNLFQSLDAAAPSSHVLGL